MTLCNCAEEAVSAEETSGYLTRCAHLHSQVESLRCFTSVHKGTWSSTSIAEQSIWEGGVTWPSWVFPCVHAEKTCPVTRQVISFRNFSPASTCYPFNIMMGKSDWQCTLRMGACCLFINFHSAAFCSFKAECVHEKMCLVVRWPPTYKKYFAAIKDSLAQQLFRQKLSNVNIFLSCESYLVVLLEKRGKVKGIIWKLSPHGLCLFDGNSYISLIAINGFSIPFAF